MIQTPETVLEYWFGDLGDGATVPGNSKIWFGGGAEVDEEIRRRFQSLLSLARAGSLWEWEIDVRDRLALVVVLDQFSRHIFRGRPASFEQDERSLAVTLRTIRDGDDRKLLPLERTFLYLPLEHSENLDIQKKSVDCFSRLSKECPKSLCEYIEDNLRYAVRHKEIIERFGRFPHRNVVLGRKSTDEEIEFLKEPMSSF